MTRFHLSMLVLIGLSLGLTFASKVNASSNTEARLKILPLECVFETVNDGTNDIIYITPEACGQFVPPPATNPDSQSGATSSSSGSSVTTYQATVLNSISGDENNPQTDLFLSDNIYTDIQIEMSVGQVLHFQLNNLGSLEQHTITLKEVGSNYVVLTIASTPFDTKIYIGERKKYDLTEDGQEDIEIGLNSITNKTASITFRQLIHKNSPVAKDQSPQSTSKMKWGYIAVALILLAAPAIMIIRKRLQSIDR
jgi:hypothetical protein